MPSPLELNGRGRRILVVDDDLAIRILLQAVLRRLQFDVDLAEDGERGLQLFQKNSSYALILLDLMMPRLNGYEFLERIDRAFGDSHPHIVVFTAAGERGVRKIPPGRVCTSILKPFDLEKFLALVSECVLERHSSDGNGAVRPQSGR
ncbi:MAG TPA: response regulator [Thermoanaerobaculia bacterium]|nr:response regulator [Thermoanaerobaculia bacterium]